MVVWKWFNRDQATWELGDTSPPAFVYKYELGQQQDSHPTWPSHPMQAPQFDGRDCGVCKAGLGPFGNGQVGFRRQIFEMCDTYIKPKCMHKECVGFHPAHAKPN